VLRLKPTEPLPLFHSWPLAERAGRSELGRLLDLAMPAIDHLPEAGKLAQLGIGWWECDLSANRLTWTDGVYDIFGFARGSEVRRAQAAACYVSESRAAMERLRSHAIEHRRGFTLDVEIEPACGERRWMRLIATPICFGDRVVRLRGVKQLI
jgi:PAS domain-containing protein